MVILSLPHSAYVGYCDVSKVKSEMQYTRTTANSVIRDVLERLDQGVHYVQHVGVMLHA
jgi:hypothetical protein